VIDQSADDTPNAVIIRASGSGKSTLLRSMLANYRPQSGFIEVCHQGHRVDILSAAPPIVLDVRKRTLRYASQFSRSIPRASCLAVVADLLRNIAIVAPSARAWPPCWSV
jgi:alpha-D-ribose 1-methylphosphonate 5-triphosphate synthase subunit PhnL